ncbi:MAG TPA: hypothetical protein VFJ85_01105 [Acidimicrobiales bacterium]|nr:hypothetical protein [Acidimicrobiales bacterium]
MGDARTARAELVLARESSLALRHVPLRPDPLSSLALALGEVDDTLGEAAEVIVDLLPLTPARRRHQLRSAIRRERSSSSGSPLDEVWDAVRGGSSRGRQQPRPRLGPAGTMEGLDDRAEVRHRLAKLSSTEPLFALQLLVWARSEIPGRAEAHLHALVACLEQFAGENHLRVVGRNLGVVHLGSDLWWRRRRFDRRVASGLFRPAGESFVTVSEIAGLLKPPTIHCRAPKVVRSGGVIPPPPFGLPTYAGQPDLLPLGTVQGSDGERVVGLPLAETLFTAHFGRAGFGKALAVDTPIPTPGGWTTMGELTPGATVFDERGDPAKVIGASDVMHGHDCYEVVFSDGSTIVADAEHLWSTQTADERRYMAAQLSRPRRPRAGPDELSALHALAAAAPAGALVTRGELASLVGRARAIDGLTTGVAPATVLARPGRGNNPGAYPMRDLLERLIEQLSTPRNDQRHKRLPARGLRTTEEIRATLTSRGRANHSVDLAGPLRYPHRALPVDPYVLGAWLGDGTSANGGITCADPQILEEIRAAGYEVRRWCPTSTTRPYSWGIVGVFGLLRALGVLGSKHVPRLYLEADIEQRSALLQGLMDTDGTIGTGGSCELSLTNRRLAHDALELIVGLGMKATMAVGRAQLAGRVCGPRYRIAFTPRQVVFRLARKRERQRVARRRTAVLSRRYIVDVRPVPSAPVRCIAVDSHSRLFLAGASCIPTHNTETAVMQFVALVRAGRGGMFLDPHGDALERISPCLTDMADRVLEINLARGRDQVQAGWNVLSMEGLGAVDVEARVSALASSFAAALSWDDRNTRALNLVTMAAQSLCELALRLPPELAPTIFQITTLLSNDDWRGEVLPYLSRTSRDFWATRFTKLAAEAITPVTNLLDRLRASSGVAALFGSSRSTYDVRAAMDAGAAVLACPAGIGDKDKLVFSLFLFDLFRATLSRRDIPPAQRRPFHAFLDECQLADSGQSSETVARMLREGRKFGLRVHAMTQQPTALSKVTLNAMLTNRSHLFSTVVGAESAAVLSKEWAGLVDPRTITRLPRYHFLVSATLGGEVTPPFLVRGLRVEDLWGEVHRPEDVPAMNEVIDATMGRRPVGDILADLDTLDDRILGHLQGAAPASAEAPVVPIGPRPRPDRVRWRAD